MRVFPLLKLVLISCIAVSCATKTQAPKKITKPKRSPRKHRVVTKKAHPNKSSLVCSQNKMIKTKVLQRPNSEYVVSQDKKEAFTLYKKNGKKFKELISSYETKMNSYELQEFLHESCVSVIEVYDNWESSYPVVYDHLNGEEYTLGSGGDYMAADEGAAFALWNCFTLAPQNNLGRCQDDAEIEFYDVNSKGVRYSAGSYLLSYLLERLGTGASDTMASIQGVSRIYLEPRDKYLKYDVILKTNEFETDCSEQCDHLQYNLGSVEFSVKAGQVSLKNVRAHLKLISQD